MTEPRYVVVVKDFPYSKRDSIFRTVGKEVTGPMLYSVLPYRIPCNTEIYANNLANELRELGADVEVEAPELELTPEIADLLRALGGLWCIPDLQDFTEILNNEGTWDSAYYVETRKALRKACGYE